MRNSWTFLVIAALALACDDGGGETGRQIEADAARVRDAFVEGDAGDSDQGPGGAGGEGGMGGVGGVGGEGGQGGDGGQGGAGGGIRMLEGCEDICGVYAECGVEADFFPGGRAACLTRCAEAEQSDRFVDYTTCMQITRCDQLQRCTIPERPLPACPDVCTALAACDPAPRLPAGLPGIADCAAACADPTLGRVVARCGLAAVDGMCDGPAFDACVLAERGGACGVECTTRAGCDLQVDPVDCTLTCLNTAPPEDPVAARRASQARTCVRNAADCDEVAACEARRERPIEGTRTVEELCAANAECGFMSVDTCQQVIEPVLRRLAEGAVDCFTDHFSQQCGEPPYGCFVPAPAPEGGCEEHCLVSDLCGSLDNQTEFECLERCQAALASGDPLAIDPYLPLFECAFGPDCATIIQCQDDSEPATACAESCHAQIDCNGPRIRSCLDDCFGRFGTDREEAERNCVSVANGCDNINLCSVPPPPDCAAYCEPLAACGLSDERCGVDCDNAHFAAPETHLPRTSCVNSTERCAGRATCLEGNLAQGDLCMAWCKVRVDCVEDPDQTAEECVLECARGEVGGQRGLVLASSEACLLANGPQAECGVLRDCLFDSEFHSFCPRYCAELGRCRLDNDAAACEATCRANEQVAALFAEQACVLNARRRGESCEAVAECTGEELPEIPRACRDLCGAEARCDEAIDPFLCGLDCDPNTPGLAVQAACSRLAACDQLERCEDPPAAAPRGCAAACGVIAACPGLVGPQGAFADFEHCTAECAGAAILLGAGFPAGLQECAEEAMCDAAAIGECFTVPEDICEAGQEAVTACSLDQSAIPGLPPLVPDYLADCRALRQMDPAAAAEQVRCLVEVARMAAGDPLACFNALACGVGGF